MGDGEYAAPGEDAPLLGGPAGVFPKATDSTQRTVYELVQTGWVYEFLSLITWASVVLYIVATDPKEKELLAKADDFGLGVACFALGIYFLRLWSCTEGDIFADDRLGFLLSWGSQLDLFTLVPYLLFATGATGHWEGVRFIRVLWFFTRFFPGRPSYETWVTLNAIVKNSKWLMMSAAYFLIALWMLIAAAYHITERANPNVKGRFGSFGESTWWSLVNLVGEFPVNNELTTNGKLIGIFTMIVAIGGVQGMPTGIISDGYASYMGDEGKPDSSKEETEEEEEEEEPTDEELEAGLSTVSDRELMASGVKSDTEDPQELLFLFVHAHTPAGRWFEGFIMLCVVLNVTLAVCDSIESVRDSPSWRDFYSFLEPFTVGIFTVEYVMRFIGVGAHADYKDRGLVGRLEWAVTFFPFVDLLSIAPFYIDLVTPGDMMPTTFFRTFRLLRLFRLFKAGKFVEGMSVFRNVIMDKGPLLLSIMYACLVFWVGFSVLMHYTERHNPIPAVAGEFDTLLGALWMTLLNMIGEIPIADYTDGGKVVGTFVIFAAIAIFGIPIAVLSDGMAEQIAELDRIKGRGDEEEGGAVEAPSADDSTTLGQLFLFMEGETMIDGDQTLEDPPYEVWGIRAQYLILTVIVLNVGCFILSTDDSFNDWDPTFERIETGSIIFFTVEYTLRLIASYGDPACSYLHPVSFLGYMFSFFGMIDMASILPWYLEQAGEAHREH